MYKAFSWQVMTIITICLLSAFTEVLKPFLESFWQLQSWTIMQISYCQFSYELRNRTHEKKSFKISVWLKSIQKVSLNFNTIVNKNVKNK